MSGCNHVLSLESGAIGSLEQLFDRIRSSAGAFVKSKKVTTTRRIVMRFGMLITRFSGFVERRFLPKSNLLGKGDFAS